MRSSRPPPPGYLGDRLLAGYHDRLHAWAAAYRARGWPPETPEYLLDGYFRLLATLGDLPRMTAWRWTWAAMTGCST